MACQLFRRLLSRSNETTKRKILKCVVVGNNAVGKTSLILAQAVEFWEQDFLPYCTYGAQTIITLNEIAWELHLIDTVESDEFVEADEYDRLRPLAYLHTDVFIICFSVVCPTSYQCVYEKWYPEVMKHCPNTPIVVAGLQQDLRTRRETIAVLGRHNNCAPITAEEGEMLCRDIGAFKYVECSSLSGHVLNVFEAAARAALGHLC